VQLALSQHARSNSPGHIVMQNLPFLPQQWLRPSSELILPTHEEMARLS